MSSRTFKIAQSGHTEQDLKMSQVKLKQFNHPTIRPSDSANSQLRRKLFPFLRELGNGGEVERKEGKDVRQRQRDRRTGWAAATKTTKTKPKILGASTIFFFFKTFFSLLLLLLLLKKWKNYTLKIMFLRNWKDSRFVWFNLQNSSLLKLQISNRVVWISNSIIPSLQAYQDVKKCIIDRL